MAVTAASGGRPIDRPRRRRGMLLLNPAFMYATTWMFVLLMYSLGFIVATERDQGKQPGDVIDVLWNSPAFEAGLTPGAKILAIDGEEFDPDLLEAVIKRAQRDRAPIELSVQNGALIMVALMNESEQIHSQALRQNPTVFRRPQGVSSPRV